MDFKTVGVPGQDVQGVGADGASGAQDGDVLHTCWKAVGVQWATSIMASTACTTRGHTIAIKVGQGQVRREGAVLGWYN